MLLAEFHRRLERSLYRAWRLLDALKQLGRQTRDERALDRFVQPLCLYYFWTSLALHAQQHGRLSSRSTLDGTDTRRSLLTHARIVLEGLWLLQRGNCCLISSASATS